MSLQIARNPSPIAALRAAPPPASDRRALARRRTFHAHGPVGGARHRAQRRDDDVGVEPNPEQRLAADARLDIGRRACVGALRNRVLAIVADLDRDAALAPQRVDEGIDRPRSFAADHALFAVDADMRLDRALAAGTRPGL